MEIPVDCERAARNDDVVDTVNYKSMAKRTIAFVEAAEFKLVETLAHRLAMLLLAEFDVAWVKLTVNKPGAIRGSRDVGITLERHRSSGPAA
jgi:dihydroneopterin aldolase